MKDYENIHTNAPLILLLDIQANRFTIGFISCHFFSSRDYESCASNFSTSDCKFSYRKYMKPIYVLFT